MRVVILGATGRLGRRLVDEFLPHAEAVTAVTRSPTKATTHRGVVSWAVRDPDDADGLRAVFSRADVVIDARNQRYDDWSGYPAMIDATLEALEGTAAGYVYVDNIYLYGRAASREPVNEQAPRRPVSAKGRIRLTVEERLRAAATSRPTAIVRFPDFYEITMETLPRHLRWFGPPDRPHQFIHTADAAHAVRLLASDPEAFGTVWHVAGAPPITGIDLAALATRVANRPIRLRVLGPTVIRVLGWINRDARGLRETQYLWPDPLILDTRKFQARYDIGFIRSHEAVMREWLASSRS
jgi:nucleoside-diphosphate-sugar epimerase